MDTTWIEVEQKEMKFMVSSSGQIASVARMSAYTRYRNGKEQNAIHHCKPRILSQCKANNGYLEVACRTNGERKKFSVHRLIGLAFVPGYFDGATINHINGNKLDNRVDNLEWVSLAKNTSLEWATGLIDLRGENQPGHKLTSQQVRIIRKGLACGLTCGELATLCSMSTSLIDLIKRGARWQHLL